MKTSACVVVLFLAIASAAQSQFALLERHESLREGDVVSLVAVAPANAWLEGRTHDENFGTVGLRASDAGEKSATRWRVHEPAPGTFAFQCLAFPDAPAWLNGGTITGRVGLALSPTGVSGTAWALYREPAGYMLKCLGKAKGVRWLVAVHGEGQVALVDDAATQPTVWEVRVWHRGPKPSGAQKGSQTR